LQELPRERYAGIPRAIQERDLKLQIPWRPTIIGGVLISISGVVNTILEAMIGALPYEAYLGG